MIFRLPISHSGKEAWVVDDICDSKQQTSTLPQEIEAGWVGSGFILVIEVGVVSQDPYWSLR